VGPYGGKSKTIWNDEFIATEIGQIGTQMDALGPSSATPFSKFEV
jgi:hypothetical protein